MANFTLHTPETAPEGARDFIAGVEDDIEPLSSRGFRQMFILLQPTEDIFHIDDRIIDEHTDGDRQSTQCHHIQTHAHGIHGQERHGKGNGNRGKCDDRRADVHQEQHQNDGHDDDGFDEDRSHVADGSIDEM